MIKRIAYILVTAVIVGVAVFAIMHERPDNRSLGERISDAASELGEGVDSAAEQLEDKSAVEQLVDDAKKTIDEANEKIAPQE